MTVRCHCLIRRLIRKLCGYFRNGIELISRIVWQKDGFADTVATYVVISIANSWPRSPFSNPDVPTLTQRILPTDIPLLAHRSVSVKRKVYLPAFQGHNPAIRWLLSILRRVSYFKWSFVVTRSEATALTWQLRQCLQVNLQAACVRFIVGHFINNNLSSFG